MTHNIAPQSDPLPAPFDNELACKSSESKLFCHNLIVSNAQLVQHLSNPDFNGDLFHYSGTISQDVVIDIAATLKQILAVTELAPSQKTRKVFSSFVEMVQNAVHYSPCVPGSNGEKIVSIVVSKKDDRFYMTCGNLVDGQQVATIRGKVEPLLDMSLDEIKQAYRQQLKNDCHQQQNPSSKGAGLGFLTLARDACQPIEYAITPVPEAANDLAYFYLTAVI